MQYFRLHRKTYKYLTKIDDTEYSEKAEFRKKVLDDFEKLQDGGASKKVILSVLGVTRATYYRWKTQYKREGMEGLEPKSTRPKNVRRPMWDNGLEGKVLALRKKFVLFGKYKITVLLKRELGETVSRSTVGRVLASLVKRGLVFPVSFYTGKYQPKPRVFDYYAQRIPCGLKPKVPGDLIQIDHMSVKIDSGKEIKHFEATCPITRYSVGQAHRRATSQTASDFLDFVQKRLPFRLRSVQVDGGSEFMGDFEKACKDRYIRLYVLPPRMPKMNCFVERMNGTSKYEFYKLYEGGNSLPEIDFKLQQFKDFYNSYRPHGSLQGLTPMEYYRTLEAKESQMF